MKRIVVGLAEDIFIKGFDKKENRKEIKLKGKIDTGATRSSISKEIVKRLNLTPLKRTSIVKSALGREKRKIVQISIRIKGKPIKAFFSIADRGKVKYNVLIGQNVLRLGKFLIDPLKK